MVGLVYAAGSDLVTFQEAGHLHFMEHAEAFNAACFRFLRKHRGR